jgi:hypothetical protein
MTERRPSNRFRHLSDAQLHEQLVLATLEWLQARGRGNDVVKDAWAIVGRLLTHEHWARGLDAETGQPFE